MKIALYCLLIAALACGAAVSFAQEPEPDEMAAMQEAWMKAMTPGVHHKHLQATAGDWEYKSKMWMDPAAPPTESEGTCKREMILGGRYLREEYSGVFMNMPYKGIGITGYDNLAEEYRSVWIDNMGTAVMTGSGQCSDDGATLTLEMEYIDAMTMEPATMRAVMKLLAPDKMVAEYYGAGPDGEEFKAMEFVFTRK